MEKNVYENRRAKIYRYLDETGCGKALVGEPLTFYYLTGVMLHPYERFMGLVLDASGGEAVAIVPTVDVHCMDGSGVKEYAYRDEEGPSGAIRRLLSGDKRIGVEMNYYTMKTGEMLKDMDLAFYDVGGVIERARLQKDGYEIEQIRLAALCADRALSEVKEKIKPGVSEKEISLALLCEMAKTPGFQPDPYIVQILTGPRSANPHGISSDAKIARGDAITADYCGYYNFYWSDYCRTLFVGEADKELRRVYEIVLEAQLAAIAAAKPGVAASEVDRAARDVITKAGYGEQFVHRTGHGLGLNVHEGPLIHAHNCDTILEEGMVFTVEPGIYLHGRGGVRIEDDVCITADGNRVLNTYSKRFEDMVLPIG